MGGKNPVPAHPISYLPPPPAPPPARLAPPLVMKVNLVCYSSQYTEPAKKILEEILDRK